MNILSRFFSVDKMVKPEYLAGDLIGTREAYSNLVKIAIPSIVEMVFVSLIDSVDVIMVGRLGFAAIASVGLATQPRLIMMSLFFALNTGVTAIVARRKGEDRREDANRALRNALVIVMCMAAVVTTISITFSRQIMLIAGAQEDTIDGAVAYFRIMSYFMPVSVLTMCINAAQRGVGNTRTAMIANISANAVNAFFNYLLIYGNWGFPRLGIAGDAWASGIGICVGLVISCAIMFGKKGSKNFLHIRFRESWRLDKPTVMSIFKIGGNSMLEQVAQRIGVFIYAIVIANLGTAAFAAHQVGMQFLIFSFNFGNGLSAASVSLVGQMLGKKRADLAIVYGKCSQRLALFISVILAASIVIFRSPLVSIFLDRKDAANALSFGMAMSLMLVVALFQPLQTSNVVFSGCLRGAGDNFYVAVVMMICVTVIRPVLSVLAVYVFGLGLMGAWGASLVDMGLRLTLVNARFAGSKWHDKKV